MTHAARLGMDVFALDYEAEAGRIAAGIRAALAGDLNRRGLVVAVSGGIDSSVCAALAVRAVGPARVFGLLLPERESSATSTARGRLLVEHLGIPHACEDITATLDAIGCYRRRDEVCVELEPGYGPGWKHKIAIDGGLEGRYNQFQLVMQAPDGTRSSRRLDYRRFLRLVAAVNFKQRIRKTLEYYHADRLNYAVVGTPNRLEFDQGFFVKNGDGAADLKPIAHLYKSQVYAMARHLGLPDDICGAVPTTDTYPLAQGQDEFYFGLPYEQMDLALWAHEHGRKAEELAEGLGVTPDQAQAVFQDIEAKRRVAHYLKLPAVLLD